MKDLFFTTKFGTKLHNKWHFIPVKQELVREQYLAHHKLSKYFCQLSQQSFFNFTLIRSYLL